MIIFLFAYKNNINLLFYNTMIIQKNDSILEKLHENMYNYDNFFINGAIGDFLLFDSFLNDQIRHNIKNIYIWNPFDPCNPKGNLIKKLIKSNPSYNKEAKIKVLSYPIHNGLTQNNILTCYDLGWLKSTIFNEIQSNQIDKTKTFIMHDVFLNATKNMQTLKNYINIIQKIPAVSSYWNEYACKDELEKKFNFTRKKYCVIIPFTEGRYFSHWDFVETFKILDKLFKMKGVILCGHHTNIKHNNIIDLSTKTTIKESIDITMNASAFIGVDSFLSIIATNCINKLKILIKSDNYNSENYKFGHDYFYNKIKNVKDIMYDFINCEKLSINIKKNLKI